LETVGKLEAEVLCMLGSRKVATVSEMTFAISLRHHVTYSTIASTLSRLYRKSLIERTTLPGPGGTKFLYSPGKDEDVKVKIVESSLERLVRAFGPETYGMIYRKLLLAKFVTVISDDSKP
jgi:predicted transcriptional regulator